MQPTYMYVGIVVPLKSVNAGLNKTIIFTCTAIANNIRWKVNKTFVGSDLRSRGFDDSSPILTLNVTQNLCTRTMVVSALSENNNTNITCFSFVSFVSIVESEAALLVFSPDIYMCAYVLVLCCVHVCQSLYLFFLFKSHNKSVTSL